MRIGLVAALLLGASSPIAAQNTTPASTVETLEKPAIGPAPAWVKPIALPSAPLESTDTPLHVLLSDQQVRFTGDTTSLYDESLILVQKPEGLRPMGSFSVQWKPDTDRITFHKFQILRGKSVIDVLGKGEKLTVLRREANLEFAMLTGILTATLQPEGLAVGDMLNIAYTLDRTEPLLKGHHDLNIDAGTNGAIDHVTIAAQWLPTLKMQVQAANMPAPLTRPNPQSLLLSAEKLQQLILPQGAPARYRLGRLIELSDYKNWADVTAIFTPLFADARKLSPNSPLIAEIAKIKAATSDPEKQASMALALTEDAIRYLFVGLGQGNLKPAAADDTWQRRFGDCKAKTTLLLALLDGLNIPAEAALVSTQQGDGLDARLPGSARFDHVIVRAVVAGKVTWLDGTRSGDTAISQLDVPKFNWALPLHLASSANPAKLERLIVPVQATPTMVYDLQFDASAGLTVPAKVHAEITLWRDSGLNMKQSLANIPAGELDRRLKDYWRSLYDFITADKITTRYDTTDFSQHLILDGTAKMDWNQAQGAGYYEIDGSRVGFKPDYHRDAGPDADAPFDISFPEYVENRTRIILPGDASGFKIDGGNVDQTLVKREFYRKTAITGNVLTMVARQRPLGDEITLKDALAAEETLKTMSKRSAYVEVTARYDKTPADLKSALENKGVDEKDFADRWDSFSQSEQNKAALAEAIRYQAAFPNSAMATQALAMSHAKLGNLDAAKVNADATLKLNSDNGGAKLVLGYLDMLTKYAADYAKNPGTKPSFQTYIDSGKYYACMRQNDYACALKITDKILLSQPMNSDIYIQRANIYQRQGQKQKAAEQADLMLKAAPNNADMQAVAGVIFCATARCADGLKAFARSIAIKPNVVAHLNRARFLPASDHAARKADIDAALKLDPKSRPAIAALADWQHEGKDFTGEAATLATLPNVDDDTDMATKVALAIAYGQAGQADKARALMAEVRGYAAGAKQAGLFNNLCYDAAKANFDLATALSDCRKALALEPTSSPILDSLGFVQLRLGQYDDAIANFTKALATRPDQYQSLYGRALAYQRKGNLDAAKADFAAAKASNPDVEAEFAKMGITP
jgi:tetratricopeptide (TPR) repeat protein